MTAKEWIDLAAALAWPTVAFGGLIYIWRSDAISKLIKISDSVKDLNGKLAELVEAEQRLKQTSVAILEVTTSINQVQEDFLSIKADIENIRDKVEQRPDIIAVVEPNLLVQQMPLQEMFDAMDRSWQLLVKALQDRFGWFDARSVAVAVRGFAHGNRKGLRLSYDEADEIARLHSSIKSYRRRQAYLENWLDIEMRDEFVESCERVKDQIQGI